MRAEDVKPGMLLRIVGKPDGEELNDWGGTKVVAVSDQPLSKGEEFLRCFVELDDVAHTRCRMPDGKRRPDGRIGEFFWPTDDLEPAVSAAHADSNPHQAMVRAFCEAMSQPAPTKYTPLDDRQRALRTRLIVEEALEFAVACGYEVTDVGLMSSDKGPKHDLHLQQAWAVDMTDPFRKREIRVEPNEAEQVDAIADMLYVVYGTAVTMGLDIAPIFAAVHAANMAKAGGPVDANGKQKKPEGWVAPPIAEMLADLRARDAGSK